MPKKIAIEDKVLPTAWLLFAAFVFALVLVIRIRLLEIPLERDEGEYAYVGQLMLQGIAPYKLAYSMKLPGTAAGYALIMSLFGQKIGGIHLGMILVNGATIGLIFILGRRLINLTGGIAAAAAYAVLSLSPFGLAGHATHFVVLPMLGGMSLLLRRSDRHLFSRLFASGFLFGLGLMMKQTGLFFVVLGAIYLAATAIRERCGPQKFLLQGLTFGAGAGLPFGITCLVLWRAGAFNSFWFWSLSYAAQYGRLNTFREGLHNFVETAPGVIGAGWVLWALAGLGLLVGLWQKTTRACAAFLLGLLIFSFLAVSGGLYFRQHYFILIFPAVALLVGFAISELSNHLLSCSQSFIRFTPLLLLGLVLSWPLFQQRKLFFKDSPLEACRAIYPGNPFSESIKIGEYLRAHTNPDDTIAVLGSEPQIYFYSHRHSATGYIYTYGLVEPQPFALQMQREMAQEISAAGPKYLLFVAIDASWLKKPGAPHLIFDWLNEYAEQSYVLAGLVNMISPDRTDYYLDKPPESLSSPLKNCVLIYQRKP